MMGPSCSVDFGNATFISVGLSLLAVPIFPPIMKSNYFWCSPKATRDGFSRGSSRSVHSLKQHNTLTHRWSTVCSLITTSQYLMWDTSWQLWWWITISCCCIPFQRLMQLESCLLIIHLNSSSKASCYEARLLHSCVSSIHCLLFIFYLPTSD